MRKQLLAAVASPEFATLKPKGPSAMTETPLTPLERELREALEWLVSEYTCNVDSCRIGGFYLDPETEDCVVEARAVIRKAKDRTNG